MFLGPNGNDGPPSVPSPTPMGQFEPCLTCVPGIMGPPGKFLSILYAYFCLGNPGPKGQVKYLSFLFTSNAFTL